MEIISEINLQTWEEFRDIFESYNPDEGKYMFRGHSNLVQYPLKFHKWDLISSFNRAQIQGSYTFNDIISQQLEADLFEITYGNYSYKNIDYLKWALPVKKCYLFQHYGIPTCFLDFTFDPLIALYFSLTSINGQSGGTYNGDGVPNFYPNSLGEFCVSIYQIDIKLLQETLSVKSINQSTFNWSTLDDYNISATKYGGFNARIGIDLKPYDDEEDSKFNYNLSKQKGCFLFYDNGDCKVSFEKFVRIFSEEHNINLPKSIITIYNINYNSLFRKLHSKHPEAISVFSFLKSKRLTGGYLFDDLQGLKYDFNFFHNE